MIYLIGFQLTFAPEKQTKHTHTYRFNNIQQMHVALPNNKLCIFVRLTIVVENLLDFCYFIFAHAHFNTCIFQKNRLEFLNMKQIFIFFSIYDGFLSAALTLIREVCMWDKTSLESININQNPKMKKSCSTFD